MAKKKNQENSQYSIMNIKAIGIYANCAKGMVPSRLSLLSSDFYRKKLVKAFLLFYIYNSCRSFPVCHFYHVFMHRVALVMCSTTIHTTYVVLSMTTSLHQKGTRGRIGSRHGYVYRTVKGPCANCACQQL